MKKQEVILRAMAGKLKWWEAAEVIGISDRTMRRWRERYEAHGYDGLFHRQRGKPSPKRIAVKTIEKVLTLYHERYGDFNVRHFHEKPVEEHGVHLSYTLVKTALQGAGLVKKAASGTSYGQNIGTLFVSSCLRVEGEIRGGDLNADATRRYKTGRLTLNVRLSGSCPTIRDPSCFQ